MAEGLNVPDEALAAVDDYRDEMDVVQSFIDNCCIIGDIFTVKAGKLYGCYAAWCREMKEYQLSGVRFSKKISEKGFERAKSSGVRGWKGIGIMSSR